MTGQNLRKRLTSLVAVFVLLPLNACVSAGDKKALSEPTVFAQDPNRVRPCEDVLINLHAKFTAPRRGMGNFVFVADYERCLFESDTISSPCRVYSIRMADERSPKGYDPAKCALEVSRFIDLPTTNYLSKDAYTWYLSWGRNTFATVSMAGPTDRFCNEMSSYCTELVDQILDEAFRATTTNIREVRNKSGDLVSWEVVPNAIPNAAKMMAYLYQYVFPSRTTTETNRFGCQLLKELIERHGDIRFYPGPISAQYGQQLLNSCSL